MNLEKATLIANYYEKFRPKGAPHIKEYLQEQGITILDALALVETFKKEINYIQDKQDENYYFENISKIPPEERGDLRHIEVIIGKDFIIRSNNLTIDDILFEPEEIHRNLSTVGQVAYKYQLKYSLLIFDVMTDDADIWDSVIIH